MSNVVSKTQQEQVVALGKLGWTTRKIEETTGCRRETVSKYLRLAGVPVRPPGRWGRAPPVFGEDAKPAIEVSTARNASQASLCEAHRADIAAKVDQGVCAKVIWEELTNFSGSYASVKRFVRQLKAETSVSSSIPVATIYTGPGKEAQVDYGQGPLIRDPRTGRLVRSRLFVMTLGWSRKAVYLLSLSSSSEVWCELHEKAFRALGGTPATIVLDNLAEGVKLPDYCDPSLNQQYAHMLKHYDVVAVPARVRDPDRKGKVERGVGYAQLRLEHRTFESLNEAQAHLDNWVATVADVRVHGTTKRVVNEHFVDEKSHLQALPVEPCRRYTYCRRKVTSTGEVEVGAQRYAAPATHVNAWVQVQHDANVVRLVDDGSGKLLLEHRRQSTTPARAAAEKAAAQGVTSSPLVDVLKRARQLGPNIGVLCTAIAADDVEEFAIRRVRAILKKAQDDGVDHVELACTVAIAAGAPTYRCVRAWLDHHKPVALAQVDPLIRQLTAYRDVVARHSSSTTTTTQETA